MLRLHSHPLIGLLTAILLALFPNGCPAPDDPRPTALVAPDRGGHLLDRPFPSDELRGPDGLVRLEGFPVTGPLLGQGFMGGWRSQVEASVRGFSAMTPIFFRVDGDPDLRSHYESRPADAVRLVSLDSRHRVPVNVRYRPDARGDPYLRDDLLVVTPDERHPLRPGERYACVVARRVVRRAEGWSPPAELSGWLAEGAGVATVFTVQDSVGQLAALRAAADAATSSDPSLMEPLEALREVASLRYAQGTTGTGKAATVETIRFADGGEEVTFLDPVAGAEATEVDLSGGPMRVYQSTIHTIAFQDPEGRPYQRPGLGILFDTARTDGWIDFDSGGELLALWQPEPMRVVVQVPRDVAPERIVVWGHGSGGDAYEPVARKNPGTNIEEIRSRLADLGTVVIGSDQPLFGRRFPLVAKGYSTNLAVVNVPNLPAFRAAIQQGTVDQHLVLRFAREQLPDALEEAGEGGDFEDLPLGVFGHSIGAQISAVAAALHQDAGPREILINGTSGFLTHSVLESDLFELDGIAGTIFQLAGVPVPDDPTPARVLGALFGVPTEAWDGIDRFHPLGIPFQLVMDGGDPLAVAASHPIPIEVFQGEGDSKLPEHGPDWLADASLDGVLVGCVPSSDYDGHFCIFREEAGFAAFERLAEGL